MLEEKLDALTKEVVALRKAIEASGLGAVAKDTSSAAKTKAKAKPAEDDDDDGEEDAPKKTPAKRGAAAAKGRAKKVEPEHDEDEVSAIMRKAAKEDKPAVRKYIAKVGCADLAELLTKPELYDAAYDFAEGILDADDEDGDDDDDV